MLLQARLLWEAKKRDYERAGGKEYLVVALRQKKVFWFVNRDGKFEERQADDNGFIRSDVFPGLWLDSVALLETNSKQVLQTLQLGLASAEHAEFAKQLEEK